MTRLNSMRLSRQTVFYTQHTITISVGEQITGTLSCVPNNRNNRDLDIKIDYEVHSNAVDGPQTDSVQYKMCVTRILPSVKAERIDT